MPLIRATIFLPGQAPRDSGWVIAARSSNTLAEIRFDEPHAPIYAACMISAQMASWPTA